MKCSHEYNMLNHIVSCHYVLPLNVLTPVRYKNYTKIYRFNVNQRPIWYKTCDDAVATTNIFS